MASIRDDFGKRVSRATGSDCGPRPTTWFIPVKEKTSAYYIVDKSGGRVRRVNTGCTDYRAAQAVLTKYHQATERGEHGLTDPHVTHLDRDARAHLAEYVAAIRESSRYAAYPRTIERELTRLFTATDIASLRDLTADRIQQCLAGLAVKAATKNKIRTYPVSFGNWLVARDRLPRNPAVTVKPAAPKPEEREKRDRRAMTRKELRARLDAVERYPLGMARRPKRGRPRKDGTPPRYRSPVAPSEETVLKLTRGGRERRLIYRAALLTGLRRGELWRPRVKHFKPKRRVFDIPGSLTQNGRPAVVSVAAGLGTDLHQWITAAGRGPDDPIFHVPEARNMVRQQKARLKLAGVPYQSTGGFADFHSLRKTVNTYLRKAGIQLRLRQRFLRHAAADLATTAYDEEQHAELRPLLRLLDELDAGLNHTPRPTPTQTA